MAIGAAATTAQKKKKKETHANRTPYRFFTMPGTTVDSRYTRPSARTGAPGGGAAPPSSSLILFFFLLCDPPLLTTAKKRHREKAAQMPPAPPSPLPPVDVPVIDLTSPAAADQLWRAVSSLGCAYVTRHGVARRTVRDLFAATRAFFAQPEEVKMAVAADANFRGYTPLGDEALDLAETADGDGAADVAAARSGGGGGGDRKAGLYFGRDLPADHPDAALALHGPNQWPAGLPGFKPAIQAAQGALEGLAERLVPLIGAALGGDAPAVFADAFLQPPERRAMAFLRPLFYPPRDEGDCAHPPIGAGAHTDYGFATLLLVDGGAPGLEVEVPGGVGWRAVPPGPPGKAEDEENDDSFGIFFNCGDMLHRWSAGRCLSARHRVAAPAPGAPARFSAAFFYDPPARCVCAPLGGGEEAVAKWPPVVYLDYLQARFAATHASYAAATGGG
jgi:isopenicillin N synthase-like dioxygenase